MKIHFYKNWRAKRAQAELEAKNRKQGWGFRMIKMPVSFFRIASVPTIKKEDLMYLRINYVDGNLTSSIEKKTPNAES